MSKGVIKKTIKNMIGGVSQQPPLQRLESQCEEMINCQPSLTDFLRRRNGLKFHSQLVGFEGLDKDAFIDFIIRGDNEFGIVTIDKNGNAEFFSLQETLLGLPPQSEYLKSEKPKDSIKLCSVRDKHFLVNTEEMVGATSVMNSSQKEHLIFIKQAAYSQAYRVFIGGKEFIYTTPRTDNGGAYILSVEVIAKGLVDAINTGNISEPYRYVWQCDGNEPAKEGYPNPPHLLVKGKNAYGAVCGKKIGYYTTGVGEGKEKHDILCEGNLGFYGYAYGKEVQYEFIPGQGNVEISVPSGNIGKVSYTENYRTVTKYIFPSLPPPKVAIEAIYHGKGIIKIITEADVEVEDGAGNAFITSFSGTCRSVTDLPVYCFPNYTLKVMGDVANNSDDYYVKFIPEKEKDPEDKEYFNKVFRGGWKETYKPNVTVGVANMPVTLEINDESLKINDEKWATPQVGDISTNPFPSFVGSSIKDIFFYKNRLGFMTNDNLILSEAGQYYNFFLTTMLALLDSDPIDITVSGTQVSPLRYVVPYSEGLFIYTDRTLYSLEYGEVLSIDNVELKPILQFDTSLSAKPVVCDTSIYYACKVGNYNQIREYKPNSNTDGYGYSNNITSHIPEYIKGNIKDICVSLEAGMMFISNGTNTIYCYSFFKDNGELLLSSWHKWEFKYNILKMQLFQGRLYIVYHIEKNLYLGSISINEDDGVYLDYYGKGTGDVYKSSYTYSPYFLRDNSGRVQDIPTMIRSMALKYKNDSKFKLLIERKNRKKEERFSDTKRDFTRFLAMSENKDLKVTIESVEDKPFNIIETDVEVIYASRS